ncbi:MAG: HEAT repeat domain-containing protein, partial [Candidatus Omnitrophica bacterium]|nr:HEAT repeat domain-containing protein [Candidatus Omnitrophota bacterium]
KSVSVRLAGRIAQRNRYTTSAEYVEKVWEIRRNIAHALGQLKQERDALKSTLGDQFERLAVRDEAARALGRFGDAQSINAIENARNRGLISAEVANQALNQQESPLSVVSENPVNQIGTSENPEAPKVTPEESPIAESPQVESIPEEVVHQEAPTPRVRHYRQDNEGKFAEVSALEASARDRLLTQNTQRYAEFIRGLAVRINQGNYRALLELNQHPGPFNEDHLSIDGNTLKALESVLMRDDVSAEIHKAALTVTSYIIGSNEELKEQAYNMLINFLGKEKLPAETIDFIGGLIAMRFYGFYDNWITKEHIVKFELLLLNALAQRKGYPTKDQTQLRLDDRVSTFAWVREVTGSSPIESPVVTSRPVESSPVVSPSDEDNAASEAVLVAYEQPSAPERTSRSQPAAESPTGLIAEVGKITEMFDLWDIPGSMDRIRAHYGVEKEEGLMPLVSAVLEHAFGTYVESEEVTVPKLDIFRYMLEGLGQDPLVRRVKENITAVINEGYPRLIAQVQGNMEDIREVFTFFNVSTKKSSTNTDSLSDDIGDAWRAVSEGNWQGLWNGMLTKGERLWTTTKHRTLEMVSPERTAVVQERHRQYLGEYAPQSTRELSEGVVLKEYAKGNLEVFEISAGGRTKVELIEALPQNSDALMESARGGIPILLTSAAYDGSDIRRAVSGRFNFSSQWKEGEQRGVAVFYNDGKVDIVAQEDVIDNPKLKEMFEQGKISGFFQSHLLVHRGKLDVANNAPYDIKDTSYHETSGRP